MVLFVPALLQQECESGKLRVPMYHLMYRFVPAVSGFRWQSLDSTMAKKLNRDNHLRHSMVFSGSPWKVEVERVKGIEPSYEAWEAAVLPLNYTRTATHYRHVLRGFRGAGAPCAGWSLLNVAKAQVLDFHVVIHAVV